MKLSFAEFKRLAADAKEKAMQAFRAKAAPTTPSGLKISSTLKKSWRRNRRIAPRAACDSFRYRHAHQWETPTRLRAARRARRGKGVPGWRKQKPEVEAA